MAVLTVAAATLLSLWLAPDSYATPFLPFYPAVVIAAWFGGLGPGLLATLLSSAAANYYMLPPHDAFNFQRVDLLRTIFFAVVFVTVSWFAQLARRQLFSHGEQQFRMLADSIPQLAWMADPDGWIFWYNQRWYDYTGTTPAQMEGWGWQAVHDPQELPRVLERWRASLQSGEPFDMIFPLRGADGVFRPFLTRIMPVKDTQGKVVRWFGTNTDISAQKRAEEALLKSEKLASVGRMAASIAHEINNPLEAVMNSVYLASTHHGVPDAARANLETAGQELQRIAHITRQTLGFYRGTSAPAEVDLRQIIAGVLELFDPRLRSKEIFIEQRCRSVDPIRAVPGEIRQVLANLVANSLDALPRQGRLLFRLAPYCASNEARRVRLTLADTGAGISPQHLDKIFEPFFTTKQAVGTGLGLWISHEIVRKIGGSIRVRSRNGKGTVVAIFFPTAEQEHKLASSA